MIERHDGFWVERMTRRHRWRTILNVVGEARARVRAHELWISILIDGTDVGIRALIAYSWTITFFD